MLWSSRPRRGRRRGCAPGVDARLGELLGQIPCSSSATVAARVRRGRLPASTRPGTASCPRWSSIVRSRACRSCPRSGRAVRLRAACCCAASSADLATRSAEEGRRRAHRDRPHSRWWSFWASRRTRSRSTRRCSAGSWGCRSTRWGTSTGSTRSRRVRADDGRLRACRQRYRGVGVPNCLESGERAVSKVLGDLGIDLEEDSVEEKRIY